MAHGDRYPASPPGRGRGLPTQPQGTTNSTPTAAAHEPLSSESSSPERRATLLSDAADLRNSHYHRLSASSRGHAAPGSAALPPRRSSSSSSPRARDPDYPHPRHHHHHHHHHRGRLRGDEVVGVSRQLTALQRVASEIRRLTRSSDDAPAVSEEDWSVFGEVMVHEGVGDAGLTTSARRTLSPASDAHLEDYIPPVEEEEEEVGRGNERGSSLETGLHSHIYSDTDSSTSVSSTDVDQKDHSIRGGGEERWWKRLPHLPTLPPLYRNILKCSLAYFLGSLFTYYAPLSRFIAELTQDGPGEKYPSAMGHMVTTV